jgi:tRNA (mo5U34)-methyltransferase
MASTGSRTDVQESISRVKWFHRIDVGNGVITPGDDDSPAKLRRLHFPDNLSGKTFLDIGAWDGFFSFEAEKRGAARVLATDSFVWDGKVPGHSQEGFLAAREQLNSKVEALRIEPLDISPATVGVFDVVLLSGVIYHMKHPWLLLERAASVTRELLIIETETDLNLTRRAAIAVFSRGELADDTTSWCAPNIPALRTMLHEVGFHRVDVVWRRAGVRAITSAARRLLKYGASPLASVQQGRCAIHARR